ncbi:hypothetical protein [Halobacillus salinus]|uniref:hypothetical protein n=1 Tax=Halobacillus salinus TaxID=192814 RepID=UPI0013050796|nr:hypothetical protein [Halobacillus salinus]
MSFWMWMALAIPIVVAIAVAGTGKKQTERKYWVALIWFLTAVVLFLIWWFRRDI